MNRLHLIRHGQTRANAEMRYCGSTDLPLSEAGRKGLAERKQRGGYPAPDTCAVYTSGMRRTEETLSILYGEIPHGVLHGMREIDFGAFEMHTYEELLHWESYQAWLNGDNERNCCPDGESGEQMRQRVLETLETLQQEKQDVLLVTHGGVIAAVMAHLFPEEERNRFDWQPAPGCGYSVTFAAGEPCEFCEIPWPAD